jgi:hypothetical protein
MNLNYCKYPISPLLFIYTTGLFSVLSLSVGHAYGYAKEQ